MHLTNLTLSELIHAVLMSGVISPERRPLLLVGIPAAIRASLPMYSRPADQFRSDLMQLNLLSSTEPLITWVKNATTLGLEPTVAKRILDEISEPGEESSAKPRRDRLLYGTIADVPVGAVVAAGVAGVDLIRFSRHLTSGDNVAEEVSHGKQVEAPFQRRVQGR